MVALSILLASVALGLKGVEAASETALGAAEASAEELKDRGLVMGDEGGYMTDRFRGEWSGADVRVVLRSFPWNPDGFTAVEEKKAVGEPALIAKADAVYETSAVRIKSITNIERTEEALMTLLEDIAVQGRDYGKSRMVVECSLRDTQLMKRLFKFGFTFADGAKVRSPAGLGLFSRIELHASTDSTARAVFKSREFAGKGVRVEEYHNSQSCSKDVFAEFIMREGTESPNAQLLTKLQAKDSGVLGFIAFRGSPAAGLLAEVQGGAIRNIVFVGEADEGLKTALLASLRSEAKRLAIEEVVFTVDSNDASGRAAAVAAGYFNDIKLTSAAFTFTLNPESPPSEAIQDYVHATYDDRRETTKHAVYQRLQKTSKQLADLFTKDGKVSTAGALAAGLFVAAVFLLGSRFLHNRRLRKQLQQAAALAQGEDIFEPAGTRKVDLAEAEAEAAVETVMEEAARSLGVH